MKSMVNCKRLSLALGVLLYFFTQYGWAQGCSDAGFCTMGALRPSQGYHKRKALKLRALEISQYRGSTTLTPIVYATTFDFSFSLGEKNNIQAKLPYQWTRSGTLGISDGWGDIHLSFTRALYTADRFTIQGTLGTKIPTSGSTIAIDGRDLPMYYQTSLGSFDLIAGASYVSKEWLIAFGYQQALTENDNTFWHGDWLDYPNQNYIRQYDPANQLKRGTDIMLRVERNFHFSRFVFHVGMLPIYRITQDEIFQEETQQRVKVDNTTGLALTATGGANYHINARSAIKLLLGIKITDRDVNPDGLTRHDVQSISYLYRF